jgi:hypothetical protein
LARALLGVLPQKRSELVMFRAADAAFPEPSNRRPSRQTAVRPDAVSLLGAII